MELSVKALDILFRRMKPERFLSPLSMLKMDVYQDYFLSEAESMLSGYSLDEQENIISYATRICEEGGQPFDLPPFYLLAHYGSQVLSLGPDGPVCKFHEILNWRDGYLLLGQDMIITAWLAYRSKKHRTIQSFAWPAIIPTDNLILGQITTDLAENHMHLYAGGSTFALSWAYLMNHPKAMLQNKWLEKLLQPQTSRGASDNLWTMKRKALYAIKLRVSLFSELYELSIGDFSKFSLGYSTDEIEAINLQREIDQLQFCFGIPFPMPDNTSVCLDYAFTQELGTDIESDSRLLAAERFLLYQCFQKCFSGEFNAEKRLWFYAYLLLKSQIRSEFIQLNRQTGFHNFQDYDRRKYKLWTKDTAYWYEDFRLAINATFHEQSLSSQEGRLSPKDTALGNLKKIWEVDRAKLYFENSERRDELTFWSPDYNMEDKAEHENYFFVLHFPKEKEKDHKTPNMYCRHEEFRKDLRKQVIMLATTLSNSNYFCHRVKGIDACSNELHCRPEVFATAFRFLREFPVEAYRSNPLATELPKLRATYHVGEDFWDIADGLRAIDEAIIFLNLRRGDRLGHALALGVDPETHYRTKSNKIVLSKQNLLDNLTWVCFRSVELGVEIAPNLKSTLCSKAQSLLEEIYREHIDAYFTLEDYYHSMFLRGDAPECYRTGTFQGTLAFTDIYDLYRVNERGELKEQLAAYRNQKAPVLLYQAYQYCSQAKQKGTQTITYKISPQYICLMGQMQDALQTRVDYYGLCIECNPSSNVLIGTFEKYQNHPILRFNHTGLHLPDRGVQMQVSVNSDDPGVFDTSLTFEYMLLAAALTEMSDADGNPLHTNREIEDYIRMLVQMGREQRFNRNH